MEAYKSLHGCYPQAVFGRQALWQLSKQKYLKENGIRVIGEALEGQRLQAPGKIKLYKKKWLDEMQ